MPIPVDLIRTLGVVLVILLHASTEPYPSGTLMQPGAVVSWWSFNVYDSLAWIGVPLFVMLSGALLLAPGKIEPLRVFFRKRWKRIGLPFLFWGGAYFVWDFLVVRHVFSWNFVVHGILTGPYYHFWYLYMLVGLYLVTPILRLALARIDRRTFRYFVVLCFVGTVLLPILGLLGTLEADVYIFIFSGWIGYYLFGAYLIETRLRGRVLAVLLVLGVVWTAIGNYLVDLAVGARYYYLHLNSLTANVILATSAVFLLLKALGPDRFQIRFPRGNMLVSQISQNSLPLYLFHVMIIESFEKGYFGFTLNINTLNPIIEIPLITAMTLFVTLGLILALKKIPYAKNLLG